MAQMRSSKDTDINGRQGKLPSAFTAFVFPEGSVVFDYGCGRNTKLVENKIHEEGCEYIPYDKYHGPYNTIDRLHDGVDVTVCANVLNVIDDDETIVNIMDEIISNSNTSIFQMFTKNGDGVGAESKNNSDQWQTNYPMSWYANKIRELGYVPNTKGNFIVVSKLDGNKKGE